MSTPVRLTRPNRPDKKPALIRVTAIFHFGGEVRRTMGSHPHDKDTACSEAMARLAGLLSTGAEAEDLRLRTSRKDNLLYARFVFSDRSGDPAGAAYRICARAVEALGQIDPRPMGVVTVPARSPRELDARCGEAIRELELRRFCERPPTLIAARDARGTPKQRLDSEQKRLEGRLLLYLVNHDFYRAEHQLRELIDYVRDSGQLGDLEKFRLRLFSSMELSAYVLGFRMGKEDFLSEVAPDYMAAFESCVTATELLTTALDFLALMKREFIVTGGGISRVLRAERMAQAEFTDPDLSMTGIAEALHMNVSQLSREFKKAKNIPLSDYIQNLRLQRAKELLSETTLSVEAVAREAGFSGGKKLYRAFDRWTGVTPGVYRRNGGLSAEQTDLPEK